MKRLVDEFKSAQNKLAGEELCELFGYTPLRLGIFVGIDLIHLLYLAWTKLVGFWDAQSLLYRRAGT